MTFDSSKNQSKIAIEKIIKSSPSFGQDGITVYFNNNDAQIVRYMPLSKFFNMITMNTIWFARMDKLSDMYEGLAVSNSEFSQLTLRKVLVSSWSLFDGESFPLWKIYLNNEKYGVAVISTIKDFMESICENKHRDNIRPLKIEYVDPTLSLDGINVDIISTRKKKFYQYENEVRFRYYDGTEKKEGISIKTEPKILINKIILSPFMPTWVNDTISAIMHSCNLDEIIIVNSAIKDTFLE